LLNKFLERFQGVASLTADNESLVCQLRTIVGDENLVKDSSLVLTRASDSSPYGPCLFKTIVYAENVKHVQNIVNLANQYGFPLTPSSSQSHFNGNALPRKGGVILDLSRMNRIKELDEAQNVAHIEPGVTWGQFQDALEAKGYRSIMPLLPHAGRSVVTDWLEREQPTVQVTEYAEPMMSMQVIWGNGEEFVTGSASINHFRQPGCYADGTNPMGPGTVSFWRFLQGAQGTMGIVTWCILKVEEMPTLNKPYFLTFKRIEDAIPPSQDRL
jgi:hypothetical protein